MSRNNPFYNGEGYPDPTAYGAIKTETALENRVSTLVKVLKYIAGVAGFDIVRRIELQDRETGKIFK